MVGSVEKEEEEEEEEEEVEENRKHRRESFGGRDSRICSSAKPICRRRPCKRVDAIVKARKNCWNRTGRIVKGKAKRNLTKTEKHVARKEESLFGGTQKVG